VCITKVVEESGPVLTEKLKKCNVVEKMNEKEREKEKILNTPLAGLFFCLSVGFPSTFYSWLQIAQQLLGPHVAWLSHGLPL
jgi:hypothetical protein